MKLRRADEVLFEIVDGTAVLVDPHGRELFTLNPVGSLVWEALGDHGEPAALADHLHGRFEGVERDRLERDIATFLSELREAGLVVERG